MLVYDLFQSNEFLVKSINSILRDTSNFLSEPKDLSKIPERLRNEVSHYVLLDRIAPIKHIDSLELLQVIIQKNHSIASVIPVGGQIPVTYGGNIVTVTGSPIKLGISYVYNEQDQRMIYQLQKSGGLIASQNMFPDPLNLDEDINDRMTIIGVLFGTIEEFIPKIYKLANYLTWQCINFGEVKYTDARSGVACTIEYKTVPELFPPPLEGDDKWTKYGTAKGLDNIIELVDTYYAVNGVKPDFLIMSKKAFNHLRNQESTKNAALNYGILNPFPSLLAPSLLTDKALIDLVETLTEGVQLFKYDLKIELEKGNERFTANYIHDNFIMLAKENMGYRVFTTVMEGKSSHPLQTVLSDGHIFIGVESLGAASPRVDRAFAVANFYPFFGRPSLLSAQKVF